MGGTILEISVQPIWDVAFSLFFYLFDKETPCHSILVITDETVLKHESKSIPGVTANNSTNQEEQLHEELQKGESNPTPLFLRIPCFYNWHR